MQLTVLINNNTLIDRYFSTEPGLSFLIEDGAFSVLFDTGYSDLFLKNAHKMEKKLNHLDFIVLSHSHLDHTWGMEPYLRYLTELEIEHRPFSRPALVTHPESLTGVSAYGLREQRIIDVIGGFHLLSPPKPQLEGTISYFKDLNPKSVHACHCTDLASKIALSKVVPLKEVGVGLCLQYKE